MLEWLWKTFYDASFVIFEKYGLVYVYNIYPDNAKAHTFAIRSQTVLTHT